MKSRYESMKPELLRQTVSNLAFLHKMKTTFQACSKADFTGGNSSSSIGVHV